MKRHLLGLIIFLSALIYGLAIVDLHYELFIKEPDDFHCTA